MEGITNETANKEQQAQNFENLKYDPLENSGNILFGNSSDPDLHFCNTNIQNLNTPYVLPEELENFQGDDKDENVFNPHLDINSKDIESTDMELLYEKRRNTLFNVVYRPPNSKIEPFKNFLKILYHIAGDFNLNLLDHDKN